MGRGVAALSRALLRMLCSVATRRMRAVTSSASDQEVRSRWEMGTELRVSLGGGRFPGPSATGSHLPAAASGGVGAGLLPAHFREIRAHFGASQNRFAASQALFGGSRVRSGGGVGEGGDFRPILGVWGGFQTHF